MAEGKCKVVPVTKEVVVVEEVRETKVVGYNVYLSSHQMALLAKLVGAINNHKARTIGMPEDEVDLYPLYEMLHSPVAAIADKMKRSEIVPSGGCY